MLYVSMSADEVSASDADFTLEMKGGLANLGDIRAVDEGVVSG
jgi:hypothetical protein